MKHAVLSLSLACLAFGACGSEPDPEETLGGLEAGVRPDAAVDAAPAPGEGGVTPGQPDAAATTDSGRPDATTPTQDAGGGGTRDAGGGGTMDAGSTTDAGGNPGADAGGQDAGTPDGGGSTLPKFSFFVTSLNAMRTLSKNPMGFGGDLRYGETGEGAGLRGADKICAAAAEIGMPGASAKQWRAFLSTRTVNARTRIGQGPWYDRMGRLVAQNLTALLKERPEGAVAIIRDDLPNELGVPNRAGSALGNDSDNHDTVTGTNASGDWDGGETCSDWTSTMAASTGGGGPGGAAGPRVGHSWPSPQSGVNWMQAHRAPGCAPSVNVVQTGGGSGTGIGNGGGYGGIYCFALTP